jgi:hypothetical protein
MNRRRFLQLAGGFAALAAAPGLVRRAFGDQSIPGFSGARDLEGALEAGRGDGAPVLVLVIPKDDGAKYTRGHAFGELLNHGSDAQLAPLAGFRVVCATMQDVRALEPGAPAGEPLMVAIDRKAGTVRALDANLPETHVMGRGDYEAAEKAAQQVIDRRIALLSRLIAKAAPPAPGDAAARAAEVRRRLVKRPVPGSRWALASGCGTSIEGEKEQLMPACGMGHVPQRSQRFVYLFAQSR